MFSLLCSSYNYWKRLMTINIARVVKMSYYHKYFLLSFSLFANLQQSLMHRFSFTKSAQIIIDTDLSFFIQSITSIQHKNEWYTNNTASYNNIKMLYNNNTTSEMRVKFSQTFASNWRRFFFSSRSSFSFFLSNPFSIGFILGCALFHSLEI